MAVAGGRGALSSEVAAREVAADPHRFALLADIHIAADPEQVTSGVPLAEHLRTTAKQILALDTRPARVLVAGDCALSSGRTGEYATLVELLKPLREAAISIDLALGNHDDRANFRKALVNPDEPTPLTDAHVGVIETPRANWFLLDSLTYDKGRPGRFGPEQLKWLARELDARNDRPALIVGHHDPRFVAEGASAPDGGLTDTRALFEILSPRRHVKTYVYGHTHAWKLSERDGIHLINLPAVAYPSFQSAWMDFQLHDDGMTFERFAVSKKSEWGKHRYDLKWRS